MASKTSDLIFNLIGHDKTGPATKSAASNLDHVSKAASNMGKVFAGVAASAGLVVLGKQALDFATDSVAAFTAVGKEAGALQRVMGGTIEEASSMRGMFKLAGVDAEQAGKSMGLFSKSIVNNADAFAGMGVAVRDAGGQLRPTNEILKDTAEQFKAMPNGAEKTALALELFGKSGTAMLPMLNRGAEGIAELERKTAEYGLTLTKVDQEAIGGAIKAQRELDMAMEGAKVTLGGGLAPLFTEAKTAMAEMAVPLTQALLPGFEAIGDVALLALTQIRDNMPAVQAGVEDFATGIRGVSEGIRDNWPQIVDTMETLGGALERVAGFAGAMWDAFRSLPPEAQQLIALLAVAQRSGVISVAFSAADLVKSMFATNVTVVGTNVTTAGATGAIGGASRALAFGAGAGLIVGGIAATALVDWSTDGLSRATSAANVYASALEGAAGEASAAADASNAMGGAASVAAGTMTEAGAQALALSGAVGLAGEAAGLTHDQIVTMSDATMAIPPGQSVDQLAVAIRDAGIAAGATTVQADAMAAAAYAIPGSANLPALKSAIDEAGASGQWTTEQTNIMSAAVAAIPPGQSAQQMGEAIREAGVKAGLTDQQIQGVTAAVNSVPANKAATITTNAPEETGKINALQAAINSLAGKTIDVGVKLSGSTGGGGAATFSGSTSAVGGWMDNQVKTLAEELAPTLMGVTGGAYAGPGGGILGRPLSDYVVSSEFGPRGGAMHYGIDLAAPMGQGIFASAPGLITQSGWNGGYGNFISMDHGLGVVTRYGHMSALIGRAGQVVGQGALIGQVGSTGDSTGPHLHFETQVGGNFVNPRTMVALRHGGLVPTALSAGEYYVPAEKAKGNYRLLSAVNAGILSGPGTGTSDSIRAMAKAGDFIVNAKASRRHKALLDSVVKGPRRMATGGVVGGTVAGGAVVGGTTVQLLIDGRALHESLIRYQRETGTADLFPVRA